MAGVTDLPRRAGASACPLRTLCDRRSTSVLCATQTGCVQSGPVTPLSMPSPSHDSPAFPTASSPTLPPPSRRTPALPSLLECLSIRRRICLPSEPIPVSIRPSPLKTRRLPPGCMYSTSLRQPLSSQTTHCPAPTGGNEWPFVESLILGCPPTSSPDELDVSDGTATGCTHARTLGRCPMSQCRSQFCLDPYAPLCVMRPLLQPRSREASCDIGRHQLHAARAREQTKNGVTALPTILVPNVLLLYSLWRHEHDWHSRSATRRPLAWAQSVPRISAGWHLRLNHTRVCVTCDACVSAAELHPAKVSSARAKPKVED